MVLNYMIKLLTFKTFERLNLFSKYMYENIITVL